jgi:pimeloyl-ACP methyl ester carboxylesterase
MIKNRILYKREKYLSFVNYGAPDGFPILIQHGLIASIEDVDLFKSLIHNHLRLVSIARPGYGESTPYEMHSFVEWGEIVNPLVQALGLDQFDILGMSSGAPYSYALGYYFPWKVRNIFIFSGIPALYDEKVLKDWPYPSLRNQSLAELESLAKELFFQNLTEEDLQKNDIRDSVAHHYFGVAQDLRLRFIDWGFSLSDVKAKVFMRHSKTDDSVPYQTAIRTAQILPNCELELLETGPHFSAEALNDFIQRTILPAIFAAQR